MDTIWIVQGVWFFSQILENFGKIANKFFGQNFLNIIFGHFMETAWIVGPLRQANMIFS